MLVGFGWIPAALSCEACRLCFTCSDLLSLLKEDELPSGWQEVPFKLHFQAGAPAATMHAALPSCACLPQKRD